MAVEKKLSNPNAMTTGEISGNNRAQALALLAKLKEKERIKEEAKLKKLREEAGEIEEEEEE